MYRAMLVRIVSNEMINSYHRDVQNSPPSSLIFSFFFLFFCFKQNMHTR